MPAVHRRAQRDRHDRADHDHAEGGRPAHAARRRRVHAQADQMVSSRCTTSTPATPTSRRRRPSTSTRPTRRRSTTRRTSCSPARPTSTSRPAQTLTLHQFFTVPAYLDLAQSKIFAITGHTHQLGTNVQVDVAPSKSGPMTPVYAPEPFCGAEPETATTSPAVQRADRRRLRLHVQLGQHDGAAR